MVHHNFGFRQLGKRSPVDDMLMTTEPTRSDEAQVLVGLAYDIHYGIYDHQHEKATNPLMSVGMHDAESYFKNTGLYRAIQRYERQNVHSRFGLSLTEYLNLPRPVVNMITEIVIELQKNMQQAKAAAENEGTPGHEFNRNQWKHIRE